MVARWLIYISSFYFQYLFKTQLRSLYWAHAVRPLLIHKKYVFFRLRSFFTQFFFRSNLICMQSDCQNMELRTQYHIWMQLFMVCFAALQVGFCCSFLSGFHTNPSLVSDPVYWGTHFCSVCVCAYLYLSFYFVLNWLLGRRRLLPCSCCKHLP